MILSAASDKSFTVLGEEKGSINAQQSRKIHIITAVLNIGTKDTTKIAQIPTVPIMDRVALNVAITVSIESAAMPPTKGIPLPMANLTAFPADASMAEPERPYIPNTPANIAIIKSKIHLIALFIVLIK